MWREPSELNVYILLNKKYLKIVFFGIGILYWMLYCMVYICISMYKLNDPSLSSIKSVDTSDFWACTCLMTDMSSARCELCQGDYHKK